jgi:hypothetical protein
MGEIFTQVSEFRQGAFGRVRVRPGSLRRSPEVEQILWMEEDQ